MSIELFDPVGVVESAPARASRILDNIQGKRAGFIFNQHVSALAFWKAMEASLEGSLSPAVMHRVYKANTWAPAPRAEVERLMAETDFALVGVGA